MNAYPYPLILELEDPTGSKDKGLNVFIHKAALGAVAAEMIGEMFLANAVEIKQEIDQKAADQGLAVGSAKYDALLKQEIALRGGVAKMGTALATLLAGHDVEIGIQAATNAVEENFTLCLAYDLEKQILESKRDQEGLDRLAWERAKRFENLPRLEKTPLQNTLQEMKKKIPEPVKQGVKDVSSTVSKMIPEPVKSVAQPLMQALGVGLSVTDFGPRTVGAIAGDITYQLGYGQATAQDVQDGTHLVTGLFTGASLVKGLRSAFIPLAAEAATVSKAAVVSGAERAAIQTTKAVEAKVVKEVERNAQHVANPKNVGPYEKYKAELAKKEILNTDPVGSALKQDNQHKIANMAQNSIEHGKHFTIKGNDGRNFNFSQIEGSLNDQKGVFEYIVDNQNKLTHQRFIPEGKITGFPNQNPKSLPGAQ